MSTFDSGRENGHDTERTDVDLEPCTERALTEYLTVLPETDPVSEPTPVAGADGLVLVCSQSGSEYVVDLEGGRCTCPDAQHNLGPDEACKHETRARFATGREPLPAAAVAALDVDPNLGAHTDASLRFAATDGGVVNAGDDAELVDTGDGRPEECDCIPASEQSGEPLACWPCRQAGFTTVNPHAGARDDARDD